MSHPRYRSAARIQHIGVLCASLCLLCALCDEGLGVIRTAAAQQLFKCTTAAGKVIYQQEKCDDTHKQSTVRPPDPVAPKSEAELKAAGAKQADAHTQTVNQVAAVLGDTTMCANNAKGWDEKYSGALRNWKSRNGAAVTKFSQDADAQARAAARQQTELARLGSGLAAHCETVGASLGPPAAK
jgi:hypothetical protein